MKFVNYISLALIISVSGIPATFAQSALGPIPNTMQMSIGAIPTLDELFGESSGSFGGGGGSFGGGNQNSSTNSSQSSEPEFRNPFENLTTNELKNKLSSMTPDRFTSALQGMSNFEVDQLIDGLDASGARELVRALKNAPGAAFDFIQKASSTALARFLNLLSPELRESFLRSLSPQALGALLTKLPPEVLNALLKDLDPALRAELLNSLLPEDQMNVLKALDDSLVQDLLHDDVHPVYVDTGTSAAQEMLIHSTPAMQQELVNTMSPEQADYLLTSLSEQEAAELLQALSPQALGTLLTKLSPGVLAQTLLSLDASALGTVLHSLSLEDLQQVLAQLSSKDLMTILERLSPSDRALLMRKMESSWFMDNTEQLTVVEFSNLLIDEMTPFERLRLLQQMGESGIRNLWSRANQGERLALVLGLDVQSAHELLRALTNLQLSEFVLLLTTAEMVQLLKPATDMQLVDVLLRLDERSSAHVRQQLQSERQLLQRCLQVVEIYAQILREHKARYYHGAWYVVDGQGHQAAATFGPTAYFTLPTANTATMYVPLSLYR